MSEDKGEIVVRETYCFPWKLTNTQEALLDIAQRRKTVEISAPTLARALFEAYEAGRRAGA